MPLTAVLHNGGDVLRMDISNEFEQGASYTVVC